MADAYICRRGGSGGTSYGLNFQVIGGVMAPSNPKENTIWVNTANEITSWIFSATEPEAPEHGMVWIVTGNASRVVFNALKKNGIQVSPLRANQYMNGEWTVVPAKSRRGDEWVDWWDGGLYSYGEEYEDITGGWGLSGDWYEPLSPTTGAKLEKGSESMTFESYLVDGVSFAKGFLRANNKIDLKDYKSLVLVTESVSLDVIRDATAVSIALCVKTTDNARETDIVASVALTAGGKQTFTLPVDSLDGSYYVGIEINKHNGGKVVVLSLTME